MTYGAWAPTILHSRFSILAFSSSVLAVFSVVNYFRQIRRQFGDY
jgi:hypothetical protein